MSKLNFLQTAFANYISCKQLKNVYWLVPFRCVKVETEGQYNTTHKHAVPLMQCFHLVMFVLELNEEHISVWGLPSALRSNASFAKFH